jgi:hypothetical protein
MTELATLSLEELQGDGWIAEARKDLLDALKDDPGGQWNKLKLPLLGEKALAAIDQALAGIDPIELMGEAWSKLREIQKLPRDKTSVVEIGEYSFERDLHALLTVTFDPWVSQQIKFTLTLSIATKAVEIKVRNRHIVAAGGGTCTLGMELKYKSSSLSGPMHLKRFDLPGNYRFKGDGIALPGSGD